MKAIKILVGTIGIIPILGVLIFAVIYIHRTSCQNQFGPEFNSKRRELQIPIIPKNWKIKQRDLNMTWWMGKELVIGHEANELSFRAAN